jgi:hypothetical protein
MSNNIATLLSEAPVLTPKSCKACIEVNGECHLLDPSLLFCQFIKSVLNCSGLKLLGIADTEEKFH